MSEKRNVPDLRFPEFSEEWSKRILGEEGEFKNGVNKSKNDFGHGSPFVNLLDVFGKCTLDSNGYLDLVNVSVKELKEYSLKEGDVLFIRSSVKREGVGETIVVMNDLQDTVYSGFLIRYRDNGFLGKEFKKYCFSTRTFRKIVISSSTTSANTNINQESLNSLYLNIPSKPEQQKIAEFLTAVDKRIELLQAKKEKMEAYKKGVMQQIFSQKLRFKADDGSDFPDWEEKKLGEVIEVLSDYTANGSFAALKENVQYFSEENYAVLVRTTDLEKSPFRPERFTDKKGYNFLKKTKLFGGEIILANVGSIGKVYRVPEYPKPMTLAPNTYLLKFSAEVNEAFVYQVMLTSDFSNKLLSQVGSSTLKAINKANLRSISIQLPGLAEQTKIVQFLTSLDSSIETLEKQINHTQTWKKGLLQKMFV